ncbi:formate dehydrogenase accessory protein FdhE [Methylocella sp.]|uniref:formate dehydrogenase accessory protein FdhE n=1 Tax=Methylocella sp. TaxID=1978226 RepID=UPI0035B22390
MRQGEVSAKGAWVGDPQGGVKAPEPILSPDPRLRFSRTAARLDSLAHNHPAGDWLRFMARLSRAQDAARLALEGLPPFDAGALARAVEARMPPLAVDGHRRPDLWRAGFRAMLRALDATQTPAPARRVVEALRAADEGELEALADAFVHEALEPDRAGEALFVAAALQVYFTCAAAAPPVSALRLLPERGLCPCCGSTPVAGLVTASGQTPGARYLYCSLCGTAWNYVRALCVACGDSRTLTMRAFEGEELVKAETCEACGTYAKMIYQAKDMDADPYADDLASLALDLAVSEAGWARHAPNPLLLVGA